MQQRSPDGSDLTSVSMKSERSIGQFPNFKDARLLHERGQQETSEGLEEQTDQRLQKDLDSVFLLLEKNIVSFVRKELKAALKLLRPDSSEGQKNPRQDEELMQDEDDGETICNREALLKIITFFLKKMNQEKLADHLQNRCLAPMCKGKLKSGLKRRFQCLFEGIPKAGSPAFLNQIYTELYITEGGAGEVNTEHEVRQIETACRKPLRPETTIRHKDMFKPRPGRDQPIRTVLTKGVAGIGKTVLTQKFTLDWVEYRVHQNIHFIFPFTFRELNVLKEKKFSLMELVHFFFTETKGICSLDHFQVLFIFDGLDESRLPLDFTNTEIVTDVTESTSVDVLLTNLIRGKLLPSALLWITTRPAAANQIPPHCVGMVTEVRGFTDPQKEEYFRKRFKDEEQASRIISHMKTSRSIHIMCHIPVFCWILATVLEDALETREGAELPNTLTEMYIHFLVVQTKMKKVKYDGGAETDPLWSPESRKMIESLGKLAFDQLQKGNLIFYESDLTESEIDMREASVFSGVLTQVFKEETGLYQEKVFCFVHLSIQEFLAALHVHLTFINSGINLMSKTRRKSLRDTFSGDGPKSVLFYQAAVDKAIEDPNGTLDLVLRFLLGLSLQTNQTFLVDAMTKKGSSSKTNQGIVGYIKNKINGNLSAEKIINLFHCLNELKDRSLVEKIQQTVSSESLSSVKLTPVQLSALAFILLSSGEDLDVFDLKKYSVSEEDLSRLLPVMQASTKAILSGCDLSERSCEALSSVLCSRNSALREMDLSGNNLQASSLTLICAGLQNPHCIMEAIRLSLCNLSVESCRILSSVLSCKSASLRHLDLTNNDLWNSGVKVLCDELKRPECLLETLSLSGCLITSEGCLFLSSALSSNPFHLKELDLTYNHPGKSGQRILSDGLKNPHWKLQSLRYQEADKLLFYLENILTSIAHSEERLELKLNVFCRMDHEGPRRLKPGLKKYACKMELDPNTAHRHLKLSDNRKTVTHVTQKLSYPDHKDRFSLCIQVLCRNVLSGRCYWEVEWRGKVEICVAHGEPVLDCVFGATNQSWSLECSDGGYAVWHANKKIPVSSCVTAYRIAVYVDCEAGLLSFYRIWCHNLNHLYTFRTRFSAPVYPGFRIQTGSVSLC